MSCRQAHSGSLGEWLNKLPNRFLTKINPSFTTRHLPYISLDNKHPVRLWGTAGGEGKIHFEHFKLLPYMADAT